MDTYKNRPNIVRDSQGAAFNPFFGDVYASRDGAFEQSRFVFLEGNNLPTRWQGKEQFVILENGFGLGTNFLSTLKAWREDKARCKRLYYVAIEAFPPSPEQILEFADPHLKDFAIELASKWSLTVPGVWQLVFDERSVVLTIYFMDVLKASKVLSLGFDALFLDGFSPSKNPEMWDSKVLKNLSKYARKNSTLSTWCVAGKVKKSLEESGFKIQKFAGFGHKKHMLKGKFEPKFSHFRQHFAIESSSVPPKKVLVVGAGLSGAAVSKEFARRGVNIEIIDANRIPASGASAIRWGIAHTQYATDDNLLFRLTRAGFRFLKESLKEEKFGDLPCGLVQIAKDEEQYQKWIYNFEQSLPFEIPESFIHLINKQDAAREIGLLPARGGLWHSDAGSIAVSQWTRYRIEKYANRLTLNTRVNQIKRIGNFWVAFDENNSPITETDVVVLCNAYEAQQFCPYPLGLARVLGRLSLVYDDSLKNLNRAVFGPGYAIHSIDGWSAIGATFEEENGRLTSEEAHKRNRSHLGNMIPELSEVGVKGFYEGYRVVSADRLPLIGEAKTESNDYDLKGLYLATAMGSRGLIFSELAARIICAQCFGEPTCVESDLIRALSPSRFKNREKTK